MQDYITIYDGNGAFLGRIRQAVDAQYTDRITGELTLSFTSKINRVPAITADTLFEFRGQYFRAVQVQSSAADGAFLLSVTCEQESVALVDDEIELFEFTGTPQAALLRLFAGTGLSAESEFTETISIREENTNRRAVMLVIAGMCGGEIEYKGHIIRLVRHRGSETSVGELTEILKCSDIVRTADVRTGVESYEISGAKPEGITVGDEVRVTFGPLGISAQKRIIGISYNPFNCLSVSVEVGEFVPDIIESYSKAAEDAGNAAERTERIEESLGDYVKQESVDSVVSASFDKYINSETGQASIVASLEGTYVSKDALNGYVEKTELSAEIGAYIDTQDGTAQIVNRLTGTFAKTDALGNYVEKTQLSAGIETYIDTAKGTAKVIAACSGTYQRKDAMSGYVTTTKLDTSIGQYIDSSAGKAKIVSACKGEYVTGSDLTGYAKVSALTTIEQSVSNVDAKISMTANLGSGTIGSNVRALLTLVSNPDSSSIKLKADSVEIDGSLYLKSSDFLASGTTMIKGAKIQTSDLYIQQLRTSAGKYIIDYSGGTLALGGGTSTAGTYAQFSFIDMMVTSQIRIGYGTFYCVFSNDSASFSLRPYSAYTQFNIGTSSYPVTNVYCDALYVGGVRITTSDSSTALKATDIKRIYAESSTTKYISLSSLGVLTPSATGFNLGTTAYPFQTLYIGTGASVYWKFEAAGIIPSSTSTYYFNLGSSSYPVNKIYARQIYLNGTELKASGSSSSTNSGDFAGDLVKMGGTTSYYIQATTSRQLCPNTSSTYYAFYLGTASYYWHYAYIGSVAASIGNGASSKLGFFGTTPQARQTVSSSATVATLIAALKKYGLIY